MGVKVRGLRNSGIVVVVVVVVVVVILQLLIVNKQRTKRQQKLPRVAVQCRSCDVLNL